jgi:hypothetical protein
MEFDAPEGIAYFPVWIMKMLALNDGDPCFLRKIVLEKGRLVKFQPHFTSFADLSNPKAVLERALKNYSCLTLGDTIIIHYGDMVYPIDITAVEPFSSKKAISIIDTDLNVDFDEPKDYKDYMEQKQREAKMLEDQKSLLTNLAPHVTSSSSIPVQNSPFFSGGDELAPGKSSPAKSNYFSKLGTGHKLKEKTNPESQASENAELEEKQGRYSLPQASYQTETVVKGQWKYVYSIDPKTKAKKLLRRVPNK